MPAGARHGGHAAGTDPTGLDKAVVHTRVTPPLPARPAPRPRAAAATPPAHAAAAKPAAADKLIVTFAHADAATTSQAHAAAGATPIATTAQGRVQVVKVDPTKRDAALASYRRQPGVVSASLDRALSATEIPNDPLYAQQSGAGYTLGWSLDAIGAPVAWSVSHGDGVKVAVLDTGILTSHEDLAGQVVVSDDFTGTAPSAVDDNGHGTHVAGIIAGLENNSLGLTGVAPRARLLNGKVLDSTGSGSMHNIITAIPWAVQQGAKVISMSLGAAAPCDPGCKRLSMQPGTRA